MIEMEPTVDHGRSGNISSWQLEGRTPSGSGRIRRRPGLHSESLDIGGMELRAYVGRWQGRAIVRAFAISPWKRSFGRCGIPVTIEYEKYFERANENVLIMLIIETTEAVENLEEIASVPGIDVLFIGAFDLCLSMGLNPFHMPLPEIEAVMDRALEVGRSSGVAVGAGAGSPEELQALARGASIS